MHSYMYIEFITYAVIYNLENSNLCTKLIIIIKNNNFFKNHTTNSVEGKLQIITNIIPINRHHG